MIKSFKVRLKLNNKQKSFFNGNANISRFVYNWALARQKQNYQDGVKFQNINISFDENHLHCFSPQFLPIYVNPRNDKIQATYHHKITHRTREEFLTELKNNSKSIVLD